MGNKRRESWLLKDPDFVPKNKNIRVVMFITINLVLISLLPILAFFVNRPYGYLCWILVFCFMILFNIQAFYIHVERYPLNDYSEYKINLKNDGFKCDDDDFYIEVNNNGYLYEVKLGSRILIFNMKGCLFPITVIKAYLGRQFIIEFINKYKLHSGYMGKNVNVLNLYEKYNTLKFIFIKKKIRKESYLIKNGKTKMNILMKSINGHGFIPWHSGKAPSRSARYYVKISEQIFVEQKKK